MIIIPSKGAPVVSVSAMAKVAKDDVDCQELEKRLMVTNKAAMNRLRSLHNSGKITYIQNPPNPFRPQWQDLGRHYLIPRQVRVENASYVDRCTQHAPIRIESDVLLREYQEPAAAALLENGRVRQGILGLSPGRGKTVISLYILSRVRTGPVLIVVPNAFLLSQWLERIEQHTSYVEGGVGRMDGKRKDWQGRGIVVTTIQSASMADMDNAYYTNFDTVVIDEGHGAAPDVYSTIYQKFDGRRLLLTATWHRDDGLGIINEMHTGPVLYQDIEPDLPVEVFFLDTGASVYDSMDPYQYNGVVTALTKDPVHRGQVLSLLDRCQAKNPERRVLVLGDRVEDLTQLHEAVQSPKTKSLIIGKTSTEERMALLEADMVFATASLASAGIDRPRLDTLFFLSPVKSSVRIKQSFGRIQRASAEPKQPPQAYVFFSSRTPSSHRMALEMAKVTKKLGYSVKFIRLFE